MNPNPNKKYYKDCYFKGSLNCLSALDGNRDPAGAKFCSKCGGSLAQTDETAISPHAKHTRLGLASLILGIVAFITIAMPIFGSIFGILAVAFGAKRRRESYGEAGIILGIVCIVINFVLSLAASAT